MHDPHTLRLGSNLIGYDSSITALKWCDGFLDSFLSKILNRLDQSLLPKTRDFFVTGDLGGTSW